MQISSRKFVIDVCGWVLALTIIFFFFTLWLYRYNSIIEPLKESWNISVTFLSALATIGAAIIAAKLVTNWKHQSQYNEIIKCLSLLTVLTSELVNEINSIREDRNVYLYLRQFFDPDSETVLAYKLPSFAKIESKMEELQSLALQIELLSNYRKEFFSETELFNTFHDLSAKISSLKAKLRSIPYYLPKDRSKPLNTHQIQRAVDCSLPIRAEFANQYGGISTRDQYAIHRNVLLIRQDIKKFREWLENDIA